MTFPGKVPDSIIKFRRHQRNAIARIVQDRTALLDHVVGAGKTFTIVSAAMELKRTGLVAADRGAQPPREAVGFRLLSAVPGCEDLDGDEEGLRQRPTAGSSWPRSPPATGMPVVMAHSSFGFLRPAPDFEAPVQSGTGQAHRRHHQGRRGPGWRRASEEAHRQAVGGAEGRLENRIKSLQQKPIDNLLDYDQIGVDQLFVDEAHLFKNLMFTTKMQNIRGLGDSKGSQRAYDMYVKVAETYAKNGRGRGGVRHGHAGVQHPGRDVPHDAVPDAANMEDLGAIQFDAWANTFASVNQEWDQKSSGDGFKAINTMSSFVNARAPAHLRPGRRYGDDGRHQIGRIPRGERREGVPAAQAEDGPPAVLSLVKERGADQVHEGRLPRASRLASSNAKGPPPKAGDNALVIATDAHQGRHGCAAGGPGDHRAREGGRIDRAASRSPGTLEPVRRREGHATGVQRPGHAIKTVKAELKEYQELQARMAPPGRRGPGRVRAAGRQDHIGKLEDLGRRATGWTRRGRLVDRHQAALRGFSSDDLRAALVEPRHPGKPDRLHPRLQHRRAEGRAVPQRSTPARSGC